jgi:phosphoglycolate phosphatase
VTYRLAIFDFDGTLADTFPWFMRVVNSVADRYRFKRIEEHDVERLRTLGAREIIRHLDVPTWKLPLIARHMRMLAARDPDAAVLFRGVPHVLKDLSGGGVTLAVVSSNAEANIRRALGVDTAARVDHFACGASLFGKAAKLRKVLRQSGIPAREAICIGDEIRDHEAAKAVGIAFGAASWGYTRADSLAALSPDVVFGRIDDIPVRLMSAALRSASD